MAKGEQKELRDAHNAEVRARLRIKPYPAYVISPRVFWTRRRAVGKLNVKHAIDMDWTGSIVVNDRNRIEGTLNRAW